jgi:putative ABC transport system ATP-binding protein
MRDMNQRDGTTFIFSTHDARVMAHAQAVVQIADGVISGRVTPQEATAKAAAGLH